MGRDESGGVDCGGACGLFFDGAFGATGGSEPLKPESISTNDDFEAGEAGFGWTITSSHFDVVGKVPGADDATFQKYAEAAEKGVRCRRC